MTSSNGNIFHVTGLLWGEVTGEFPTQRPVMQSFEVSFDLHLNKQLSKQWRCWWLEMLSSSLWRQCSGYVSTYWCLSTKSSLSILISFQSKCVNNDCICCLLLFTWAVHPFSNEFIFTSIVIFLWVYSIVIFLWVYLKCIYRKICNIRRTKSKTQMFLVSACSCRCPIHWNQVLSP